MKQHFNDVPGPRWLPQGRRAEAPSTQAEAIRPAGPQPRRGAFAALAFAVITAGCGGGGDDPPALPAVAARTCGATSGPAIDGLDLSGVSSFSGLSATGSASGTVLFDPGEVTHFNPALPAAAVSGRLRASLWALNASYTGGTLTGQLVARSPLVFAGGSNQLGNNQRADVQPATLSAVSPSRGSYCMVITLEELAPTRCAASDGYCIVDWAQFATSNQFQ